MVMRLRYCTVQLVSYGLGTFSHGCGNLAIPYNGLLTIPGMHQTEPKNIGRTVPIWISSKDWSFSRASFELQSLYSFMLMVFEFTKPKRHGCILSVVLAEKVDLSKRN
jgi:hypothetical protein